MSVPRIDIEACDFGRFPVASTLNARIPAGAPLLRATLAVRWDDADASASLQGLEASLLGLSPSFRRHQCRGPSAYHVFGGNGRPRAPADFEPGLALAHLLEHVVIDFECAVTDAPRCSGVTGALRARPGWYHMFVECPEKGVGRLCLALARRTLDGILAGVEVGASERQAIASARLAYRDPDKPLTPPAVARRLACLEAEAGRALDLLSGLGYLREVPYSVNFSGVPTYRLNGVH